MDSLRELLNQVGPNLPFMMAGVGGNVKMNGTRVAEISVILLFLWLGFNKIEKKLDWINDDYLKHKATTEQKLEGINRLGKRMERIENVVFTPINDSEIIRRR